MLRRNRLRGKTLFVLGAAIAPLLIVGAAAQTSLTLEATFVSVANGWAKVERWKDNNSNFGQESFPSDGRGDQTGQCITFFAGQAEPNSARFLMYYAPGWDSGTIPVPVLLVHGANQTADVAWANANDEGNYGCGQVFCPDTRLMQELVALGYSVFAVNFPHKNGDGYFWTQQIADAVDIVKESTGALQVDIVAWSKGAFNARMYASSVTRPWGTPYRGDIRRLILLGSPNNGVDGSFRHGWSFTPTVYSECGGAINGPVAHDWMICFGLWRHHPEWTYSSSFFPGSAQMLKKWDTVFGLPTFEQDWWTTFYGGWGFYTHSEGIDTFLGASLVNIVRNAGVPSGVRVHNLCGSANDIAGLHNEHTGPSDGVVFIASCNDDTGVANPGGNAVVPINHLELGWHSLAVAQIEGWLSAP
ncbi:MAG: esterase/lipase family protein [Acidobacteriota bacterium]